jgi:hypothetical protein
METETEYFAVISQAKRQRIINQSVYKEMYNKGKSAIKKQDEIEKKVEKKVSRDDRSIGVNKKVESKKKEAPEETNDQPDSILITRSINEPKVVRMKKRVQIIEFSHSDNSDNSDNGHNSDNSDNSDNE